MASQIQLAAADLSHKTPSSPKQTANGQRQRGRSGAAIFRVYARFLSQRLDWPDAYVCWARRRARRQRSALDRKRCDSMVHVTYLSTCLSRRSRPRCDLRPGGVRSDLHFRFTRPKNRGAAATVVKFNDVLTLANSGQAPLSVPRLRHVNFGRARPFASGFTER